MHISVIGRMWAAVNNEHIELRTLEGVDRSSDRDGSWRLLVFICVCDSPPVHCMESKRAEVVRMETSPALLDATVLSNSLCFFFPCVSALRSLGSDDHAQAQDG